MNESNRIEYKRELTDSMEKKVVAFLNYREGGFIYLGIDNTGRLPHVLGREKFFDGYSIPRNKEIMRIFKVVFPFDKDILQ